MKTTFISKENNQVKFSMDFTAEEFDNAVVHAYKQSKNQFTVDGFRRGKASRSVIEKRYGEGIFFEDAINELFREGYTDMLGVLADYGGRGVAPALLTAAMRAYQRDGMEFAAAGVDSDSPTGAVDLYRELGYAPTQGSILYALDV